ncbi:hypothetical protein [Sagittula salina]|uniref:Uncharacterized protein n=1 Tax=Sagittula salina TaxID=2820268 RepID=A0A940MQY0_9RHOB|nr:hypothetical protein [Sagittula salina]MBP0484200.1 hypothetical protein [Sagittula salina]
MDNKAVLYGVGGVLVGLLGGAAIGGAVSSGKMEKAIGRTLAPAQEAQATATSDTQAALAGIGEKLAALEAAVTGAKVDPETLGAQIGEQTQGVSDAISGKLDDMQGALGQRIDAAAKAQTEAMQTAMADLSGSLTQSAQIAASAVAAADGGESGMRVASEAMELSDALGVGQTVVFAGGDLRVFVSRLDKAGGSARLMIDGDMVDIGTGGTTRVSLNEAECSVAVMALTPEGVTLGSDCAGSGAQTADSAEAEAEPEEAMDQGTDQGAGQGADQGAFDAENAVKAGGTLRFADGKLRAYVVSVDESAGAAKVAINGFSQTRLSVGESVEVAVDEATCSVTLTGVQGRAASLDGSCE